MATLVWFRTDLRLADNPALHHAQALGQPIIPVYIHEPSEEGDWLLGGASKWWMHHSLAALEQSLTKLGSRLIILRGPSLETLQKLIAEHGITHVVWNRRYEPAIIQRDERIKTTLKGQGIDAQSFNGSLLHEPWEVKTREGKPYQVYTPMWKAYQLLDPPREPLPAPKRLNSPEKWPASVKLEELKLLPFIKWDTGFYEAWSPGEAAAQQRLKTFVKKTVGEYKNQRDMPGIDGTSQLSPYLHFGDISPNQIWYAVQDVRADGKPSKAFLEQSEVYLKEVVWREFAYHLLFHFPHTPMEPLRAEFNAFPWNDDNTLLRAWQRGRTGYPIVDAGMRQLWHTGWMHNRVRMIVASFLVKHLLIPWQRGAEWFWDTLVDADLASNTLGWQWTAGCGADAAPYFRVFNPMTQGSKFDAEGAYVKRWVPELAKLPAEYVHAPWEAPPLILAEAGIILGKTYPHPIVDHNTAREAALAAYARMRGK